VDPPPPATNIIQSLRRKKITPKYTHTLFYFNNLGNSSNKPAKASDEKRPSIHTEA